MSLPPAAQDLARRLPVWQSWSDIYLDTQTSALSAAAVRDLATSEYTIDELREILWEEIHPACIFNLMIPSGGEWAGFTDSWLEERILRRASARFKLPARWFPGRSTFLGDVESMLTRIAEIRRGGKAGPC